MTRRTHRYPRWLAGVAGGALVASSFGAAASVAQPAPEGTEPTADETAESSQDSAVSAQADVAAEVLTAVEAEGSTDFWVRFEARPDLTQFHGIADWEERGWAVYNALTAAAESSQAQVRAELDADGVSYSSYWAANVIRIEDGDAALLESLSTAVGVDSILADPELRLPDPVIEELPADDLEPYAPEWGLNDINAPQVWDELGITGEGIVIGTIDTGVQYDHPALVNQYRGNLGDGDFDHNYNWYNWGHGNADHPADTDGTFSHGTHVTGTVVGDDGGENQIGVAPGAQWIAANGCCPGGGFEPLLASGEWMIAPTDLAGDNPDPAQRPHIINNSWGTGGFVDNDLFDDVSEAWAAAGQLGIWALGNAGPSCQTGGSPGNRAINFSVGNYDSNHVINVLSSRGPGVDGVIKPEISAPGTAVRSAQQGNNYGSLSGTSMASPHVAGAAALLWSGAPTLVGDLESTKELLTGTAIETENLTCGGTPENNNVFGNGRLDAYELLINAPLGDTGVIEGTVIDAEGGAPIAGATVTITGEDLPDRVVTTDADGEFSATLVIGDFLVTAEAFGYADGTTEATIVEDEVTTVTIELNPVPTESVTGTVTDGSGNDWPLYAEVSVIGTPESTYTDPVTGTYALDLPQGEYTLRVVSEYDGYLPAEVEIDVPAPDAPVPTVVVDVALLVDLGTCQAPGYTLNIDDFLPPETFDGTTVPEGWTVTDDIDSGYTWVFDDPANRGNNTGGEGGFAIVDSDFDGSAANHDTSLITPVLDFTEAALPILEFKQDYYQFLTASTAYVDYTADGGATWTNLLTQTVSDRGPATLQFPLDDAVGSAEVQVRFRLVDPGYSWYWQIDDVVVFSQDCVPDGGGLVVGHVYDGNDATPINGATVTHTVTEESVTTGPTDDPELDDGFYVVHSPVGTHELSASATSYSEAIESVTVTEAAVSQLDFALGAPEITVDPTTIETTAVLGEADTAELTITNTGTGSADVVLQEFGGDFEILRADGSTTTRAELFGSSGAPEIRLENATSPAANAGAAGLDSTSEVEPHYGPSEEPWIDIAPYPAPLMDGRAFNVDGAIYNVAGGNGSAAYDTVYRYDPVDLAWTEVASLPTARNAVAGGVIDGQIIVSGGWFSSNADNSTYIYDPATDTWTEGADAPVAVSAAGQAVYDDLLYLVGGCTTGACDPFSNAVQAYDPASDTWTQVANYPETVAFTSCGGLGDGIYCAGGFTGAAGTANAYYYDPAADTWEAIPAAPAGHWGASSAASGELLIINGGDHGGAVSNRTFAFDADAGEWIDLPNSNQARFRAGAACGFARIGGSVGAFTADPHSEILPGFDLCAADGAGDVPWLELSEYEFTVDAGETVTVIVTTDSAELTQPGTYTAGVRVTSNAPGSAPEVPVTFTVTPPLHWGKILGTVEGDTGEEIVPLAGAGVDLAPQGSHPGWYLTTDADGDYASWIDDRVGIMDIIATYPEYRPGLATVTPVRGVEIVQDFLLIHLDVEVPVDPINPNVDRIYGANRYETAAAISEEFEPGVPVVFLASGADFPDALSGAALAGHLESPVLLTRPDHLPRVTQDALHRLAPEQIVVLGSESAIHASVFDRVDELTGYRPVHRWEGDNRYETAALVAAQYDPAEVDTVYVASGANHADALAAGTRAGLEGVPVLLVRSDHLPNATRAALTGLDPDRIVLLGSEEAVDHSVFVALSDYADVVDRVAGDNRYHTAALLFADYPTAGTVYIASGSAWPDAIAGAPLAATHGSPMLLVNSGVPGVTWDVLTELKPVDIHLLGSEEVISEEIAETLRTLE